MKKSHNTINLRRATAKALCLLMLCMVFLNGCRLISPPATGVSLAENGGVLDIGEEMQLQASVAPAEARQRVNWQSSDESIATVDKNGVVTPHQRGEVSISASTKNGEFSASHRLLIGPHVESVALPESLALTYPIQQQTLSAQILPADAVEPGLVWQSSAPEVVTVDTKGVLQVIRPGEAEISATSLDGGIMAVCIVNIDVDVPQQAPVEPLNEDGMLRATYTSERLRFTNDKFSLTIPANTWYSPDIEQRLYDYMTWLEEASGLQYYKSGNVDNSFISIFYKQDVFATMEGNELWLPRKHFLLDSYYNTNRVMLSLGGLLANRSFSNDNWAWGNGIEVLAVMEASRQHNLTETWNLVANEYSNDSYIISSLDMRGDDNQVRDFFANMYYGSGNDFDWANTSPLGWRFCSYLQTTYGHDILAKMSAAAGKIKSNDKFIQALLQETSETVFDDFLDWYEKNEGMFFEMPPAQQYVYSLPGFTEDADSSYSLYETSFSLKTDSIQTGAPAVVDMRDYITWAAKHDVDINELGGILSPEQDTDSSSWTIVATYSKEGELLEVFRFLGNDPPVFSTPGAAVFLVWSSENMTWHPNHIDLLSSFGT